MNQLINETTNLLGTQQQTIARLYAYEKYAAEQVPVIWVPWAPSSYVGTGLFSVHSRNIHGTVSTFNEITNLYYPNRWTLN
jgi:peptide/nickel transport system substrate-binding protein